VAIGFQQVLAKFFATASEPEMFFTSEGDKASKWRFLNVAAEPVGACLVASTTLLADSNNQQLPAEEGLHAAAELLSADDGPPPPLPPLELGQPFFTST
jgi:hypothetical protein